jgi:hypothetical protein
MEKPDTEVKPLAPGKKFFIIHSVDLVSRDHWYSALCMIDTTYPHSFTYQRSKSFPPTSDV